jgi:hypothetical protein
MGNRTLLDVAPIRLNPHKTETHKWVPLGAALCIPYMPPDATCVLIQATGDDVRFTLDGTTPSAIVGFRLFADGFPLFIEITEGMILQFFGENANSVIQYQFGE